MAAHDLINAAIKANDKAMKTAIKNGLPVQLPANQYLPKAMNGNIDLIHLGQFAGLDAGFDEYRKQQTQAASQDFSDLDAGFAEWSAGQGGQTSVDAPTSVTGAVGTGSTSVGGQSTGSRSGRAYTGRGTAQEEIPSLDNMAVPVTAKTTTKTAAKTTKAEKKAEKEVKQANSTLSKADKALQTAQKKQTVAENNLRKKLDRAENEAQKADAMRSAAKVTKKGNTTVIEPAQNVQQTKRKMQNLAKEEARAQAEYTKAQNDVRKAEERAKKAADRQQAANDRAQAVSAFAARRTANSGTVSSAEQVTNNAVRRDIIDQAVNNQISSYNAMPKASAVRGTSGRVHSGNGRTGALADSLYDDSWVREREAEDWLIGDGIPVLEPTVQSLVPTDDVRDQIQQRQAEAREATNRKPANTPEMSMMQSAVRSDALRPQQSTSRLAVLSDPNRRLTKEEQAEAEQIIRDYNREHGIHGGIEGWYDGPDDPLSPEYLEYAAVQRLKAKTTGGAIGSGMSDAYNLLFGTATEGAAKLADFVTGDPNNNFSQSIRQANDLRDQTMQASQVQAPLAYAGGNLAGKMLQYMGTEGIVDAATGALGITNPDLAFWANQGVQNLQDYALNEIPDLIDDLSNGVELGQALQNFGKEAKRDFYGNLIMGTAGDIVVPALIERFGKGAVDAAESVADAERAVSNTPAPVDDSVDAALYGTGIMQDLTGGSRADIPELGRPFQERNLEPYQLEDFYNSFTDTDAGGREGSQLVMPYVRKVLDYDAGRATLDEVDEAFNQAQFELGEARKHLMDPEIQRIINPDYSGPTAMYDHALRKFGEKYPEQAGAYRQAQDAYNAVINNPEATREEIIAAHEQLVKAANGFDGKIRRGEAAPRKAEINEQLAELKRNNGAGGSGKGTMKIYADPEWVEKQFGTKTKTAQERLEGTGIVLVGDPRKASKNIPMMDRARMETFLSDAIRMQSEKNGLEVSVDTSIGAGKNNEKIRNFIYSEIAEQTNDSLRSHGYWGLDELSPEQQAIRDFEGEEWAAMVENWPESEWRPQAEAELRSRLAEIRGIAPEEVESPYLKSIAEDTGIPNQTDEVLDIGADKIPSMEEIDNIAARRAELQARADGIDDVGGTFYDRHTGEVVPQEVVEQLDAELREANRQFDEAVANAPEPKDIGGVRPQTVDDSDELPFLADEPATAKSAEEATSDIPILADNADEVTDAANHANRSNNVTMTEEELDEAIADTPPLGPKVDPVDRQLERVAGQSGKSREYIGKTRTNSIQNSGIDDLAEQTDVIPESLFKHSSIPEKQTMHNAYLKVELEQQAQIDRFAKRMSSEELGQLGSEDVDTMFILRNTLNKQAREATDEATKAELYRLSREVALNIDQVGHSRGQTLQSFRKWAHTYDGAVATAEGRLYKAVDDQLRSNPRMQAEIDSVAHQIFDRIGEIDSIDDVEKQVHDIVRQAMEDSRYLSGKVDDATVTKLTDSILKEKSFEGIQEQLDFLATGHEHLSMDTLDQVQKLFDEASEFDYGSKDYYQREMQAYALLANDMFPKGSSFRSKFDQWRYFAMLANPTTHIKNMTGNVLFGQGAVSAKNNLAAVIEASADRVSKATGGKGIDRTKSVLNVFSKKDKGLLEAARQDAFDKSYRALTGTGRYLDPARGIDQAIPTWSTQSRLGRALNAATGFNNRLLSGEDEVAMIAKYQTSLAGYLKANGYDANIFKATDDESLRVLDSARAYALRQAEEAAFHQNSNLAKQMTQFTQNLRNSDKLIDRAVGTAADIAIPFKKTPINILKSCFAYSPLEFAKVAAEIPDLYKGVIKPADFIDDLSKGLTGTAGLVIGALLAHGGVIEAGSSEGDKEAAFDKTAGRQNNAVKIGGKQIGLAELVPAAAPIIFGAIMYETKRESEKNGNAALDTIVNGAMGLTDAVTDMTMLSGIADIIADAKSAQSKGETFTNIAGGLAENLVGQMLPTVGRKAEITVDDTKRSTYSDRSGTMKQLDSSAKYWQTKIPGSQALGEKLEQSEIPMLQSVGSRLTLEPAVDAWGREIKQTGGNLGGRAAYNFLSPVTISSESQDPTDQELYALSDQTGSDDVFHQMPQTDSKFKVDGEDVKLTESQWTEYQKLNGTRAKELVDALINSELYAGMSDDDKVEAIKNIYSYTKDAAQHEVGGKALNSTNAKMDAAYQEGGAEGLIQELEYRNGLATAENETGLEVANNAKTRGVYEEYGAEGVQAYAEMKDRFNEIKAGREEQYGKGSKNVNIMTTLTLLNENPDQADVILGSIANNPDKYEQTDNGWVYHQGDSVLTADDVTEPVAEPVQEAEAESSEPLLSGFSMPEQPQQSQAKEAAKAARQQMSELRATQQPEAEEIPVLEEQPKPVQQTASNVEINPATGRPVAPTRQTAQAEPAVEIDPRTGRPKAPTRSDETVQGEIPKLEPNGDATWNNSWKIENSKSYGRFRQVDPSYNASDYARVYNAMDTDNSGKLKKAEIQSYLDAMSGVDEAYRWAMFNAFAQSNWSNPYKK